jgi:probable biosynthetic protein (TIGR04098 family)
MKSPWHDNRFVVQMPHMAPGERLSEVEFLKLLAAYQWSGIAHMLGRKPSEITNDARERLYGSVIDVEMKLADPHSMEVLGEDAEIRVRNRVTSYAKKFVEGLFVIDDHDVPDSLLATIKRREDLRSIPASWAAMTNAFIAPTGSNTRLKVYKPAGIDEREVEEMATPPQGVRLQAHVQGGAAIEPLDDGPAGVRIAAQRPEPILYHIVHESDLNGAGLVYFARYESMMNYGERKFLGRQLDVPVSNELVSCLSTEHRKAYFFANASPGDDVDVRVEAELLPPGSFAAAPPSRPHRTPMKFRFRLDLYRSSDNVLMATSLVRKALNVPGSAKAVLMECDRLLKRWT